MARSSALFRESLRAGLCALFCAIGVAVGFLWANEWNPTAFFRIGDGYPHPGSLPADAIVHRGETGYDGQFFLALAYDPGLRDPRTAAALDHPRYRARRILFPALAHVLALGQAAWIPWSLIAINVLAVAGLAAVVAHELAPGEPALLFVPLAFQGVWVSFLLSTADLLGVVFFLVALTLARRNQMVGAGAALLLATLTREIYILQALLLAADCALTGRRRAAATVLALQLPAVAWNVWVLAATPAATIGLATSFGVPGGGIVQEALHLLQSPWSARNVYEAACFVMLLLAAAGLTAQCARHWRSARAAVLFALPLLVALLCARVGILGYFVGYSRAFLGVFFLLWFLPADPRFSFFRAALTAGSAVSSVLFIGARIVASVG